MLKFSCIRGQGHRLRLVLETRIASITLQPDKVRDIRKCVRQGVRVLVLALLLKSSIRLCNARLDR
jgi:hypothetical protein